MIIVVLLAACVDNIDRQARNQSAILFSLQFPNNNQVPETNSRTEFFGPSYFPRSLDCTVSGNLTVEARIYDNLNHMIASGGPWDCDVHQGTILGVPPGISRRLVIVAKSGDTPVFFGEAGNISVVEGQSTHIGTIAMLDLGDVPAPQRYALEMVSGGGQTWGGGGMPFAMVFRIYDHVNEMYIENGFPGLQMRTDGVTGSDNDWCWSCYSLPDALDLTTVRGWWYVDVCAPPPPYQLVLMVNAVDTVSGESIINSPYTVTHTIARSDSYCQTL